MALTDSSKNKNYRKKLLPLVLAAVTSFGMSASVFAQEATPAEPTQITWDLTEIYASDQQWEKAYEAVQKEIADLENLRGTLKKSAKSMATAMEKIASVQKEAVRVYVYTSLKHDTDQRDEANQAMFAKANTIFTKFGEATSWISPEILAIGGKKVERFIKKEPRLKPYDYYLRSTVKSADHLLDEDGETLLASASAVLGSPNEIYELLVNADVKWPEVELSSGDKVTLNQAGYARYRSAPNREDRKLVFDTFWQTWYDYRDSIGKILSTEVQSNIFTTKARKYDSVLQRELEQENLPEEVYRTLVSEVNNALPVLHRYFKLRGEILGIEQMRYYDIYPPLVTLNDKFGVEESKAITLEVLKPLGEEYYEHLKTAVNSDWSHVYPQPGKRSGAYMNGSVYDVHPYVLLNHNDDYNSLSTYAHEFGHAVHSQLANENQPYLKASYSTFTAEIASIINEILLEEYLIERAETKEEKLFYLGQALESVRGTFFRQTMFAEFELKIHETAEAGEPLTGANLNEIYGDLLKKYHGHDEGVLLIDDVYASEWAYIPHFYYNFYVFQYATSMSGAAWFAEKLLAGDEQTRDAFIDVLKAGGSDDAYKILKKAGLDMATPDPYRATARRMEDIMNRIEALL
ncbi:oligoendopeptidase F [Sessilibacter corallicola]|uniref:oligoendopeptidase F n=1 Tax=Sessilibacter corallicola TaxID=2904075 RepID=UPI001E5E28B4|nr:oligoendopeptidase F [Sessilibacter corallicola]MCE2027992.1 oligoendopeptidase F [Sessilibacter corallicola]